MNRLIRRSVYLSLLLLTGLRCKRDQVTSTVYTGKLVVQGACDHFIVQVLNNPLPDSSIVVKSWTDSQTDSSFTNVFKVANVCTFAAAHISVGQVFTFTLDNNPPPQTCYTCDVILFADPTVSNSITDIKPVTAD